MKWYDTLKATGPFGWISWLISAFNKNDNTFNKIGEGVNSAFNRYTGAGLTNAEREANAWSAEQAQQQRAWEEEMRNTSFQAQVKDMQKAGLNTALMYGGTGSSGATVPSSSAPSSVAPSSGNIGDLIGSIMDIALLGAQIKNINADTRQKNAGAAGQEIQNEFSPKILEQNLRKGEVDIQNLLQGIEESKQNVLVGKSQVALNEASVKEVLSRASKEDEEAATERLRQKNIEADTNRIAEEIINMYYDRTLKVLEQSVLKSQAYLNNANAKYVGLGSLEREFENQFREEFGTNPNQPIWNAVTGMLGRASNNIVGVGEKVFNFLKGNK